MKKLLSLAFIAIVTSCPLNHAGAAIVSFGFSGTVTYLDNRSNALPANISWGAPFTGVLTYDTSRVLNGADSDPSINSGAYYFNNGGIYFAISVAGHTITTTAPNTLPYADIIIYNWSDPQDVFWVDASMPTIRMDGAPFPAIYTTVGLGMQLYDNTGTAYNTDALPTTPPQLSAFPNSRYFSLYGATAQGTAFSLTGTITKIGEPQPVLNIRSQPGNGIQLSWPLAASGFGLQQNTNLAAGIGWQTNPAPVVDTAIEHTVTLPAAGSKIFRLVAP